MNNSTSLVALLTSPTAKSSITADHTNHRKHQLRTDDSLASSYELEEDWEKEYDDTTKIHIGLNVNTASYNVYEITSRTDLYVHLFKLSDAE